MPRNLPALVTIVAALVTLGLGQPPAQQPPAAPPANQPPPPQPPVFRTGTNQVRVDVTVLDRKGEPVPQLTKDDFDFRARSGVEEAQMYRARDIEMLRSQVTASALESTIAFLGSIKEGRKAILFVSQTIGRVGTSPMDTFTWLDSAIRIANANNTTIYVLDPRGLDMNVRPSDILHSLAEQTGGRQYSNNEPASSLREIVRTARAFYLLGYASAKNPADGQFHKIAVKVKRPGVEVRARTGYYAPSTTEMDSARKKAAAEETPTEISKALATIVDAPHMAIAGDLWAGTAPRPDGRPRVTVALTPP